MSRAMPHSLRRRVAGVTLIELMVAMVLGLLVSAGIITVFVSTSKSNRAQTQMARMQEEGRFAVGRMTDELRMANAPYCSGTGGVASDSGPVYVDGLRAPTMLAKDFPAGSGSTGAALPDNTTSFGAASGGVAYPTKPTEAYALPSFLYMRGYECGKTACTNIDPHSAVSAIPAMGTAIGNRVVGADVLTMRYLDGGRGWAIGSDDSSTSSTGVLQTVTITPETGEPPMSDVTNGDLVMLADCSNAQVFAASFDGASTFTVSGTGANFSLPQVPADLSTMTAPRLFDFSTDFRTVTYYLQVVTDDNSATGNKTGALMRRVNGGTAEELVRGIERLDFRYGVEDDLGRTVYLSAAQVDSGAGMNCPKQPPDAPASDAGCLWRAVKSIEVSMLLDGHNPLPTLTSNELVYAYGPDGSWTPKPPTDTSHTIKPADQGFARGMLRRQFTALVAVRNYNP